MWWLPVRWSPPVERVSSFGYLGVQISSSWVSFLSCLLQCNGNYHCHFRCPANHNWGVIPMLLFLQLMKVGCHIGIGNVVHFHGVINKQKWKFSCPRTCSHVCSRSRARIQPCEAPVLWVMVLEINPLSLPGVRKSRTQSQTRDMWFLYGTIFYKQQPHIVPFVAVGVATPSEPLNQWTSSFALENLSTNIRLLCTQPSELHYLH